jgi:hypothetical protein
MTYESAPATLLLATHCCACGRPLVDAESVEAGMGPDCRKKYGYNAAQEPADFELAALALSPMQDLPTARWAAARDARAFANKLVSRVAVEHDLRRRGTMIGAIHALGFSILARKLLERANGIVIEQEGDYLLVRSPFSQEFNQAVRSVPGQRWVPAEKVRAVPVSSRRQLWEAIKATFPGGTPVFGSRGLVAL